MIPSVRESSQDHALVVYRGYYISFLLPRSQYQMWRMRRIYVTRRVHPTLGEQVPIPRNVYRYMRHVAFNAIMLHQARLRAVRETPPRLPEKQYRLEFV